MLLHSYYFLVIAVIIIGHDVVTGFSLHDVKYEDQYGKSSNFPQSSEDESHKDYWISSATDTLLSKISDKRDNKIAKNIIFFLGDGMSVTTVTASRIFQGQLKNRSGEEERVFFETFPCVGLSKTYCVDSQVADSACSGTAFMTGVKGNIKTIGVTSKVHKKDCKAERVAENRLSSLIKWAQDAGKDTGIITTTRITHATPAAGYARTSFRDFECDADISNKDGDPNVCTDIASQLIFNAPGKHLKVIMGGGRTKFLPKEKKDPISGFGQRMDGVDLIEKWKQDKTEREANAAVVFSHEELEQVDTDKTDYLLALLETDHLKYQLKSNPKTDPSLSFMTKKSIDMLKKSKNGFVLFVEGGRIDMAHHSNMAILAFGETLEFAKAVEVASNQTDIKDTLIVVTADHSHVMTLNGYPERGSNILKFAGTDNNKLPYTTLSYANGPGYHPEANGTRYNLTNDDFGHSSYMYPAMVKLEYETHGGDDVPVYARGPWSHLFTGVFEQNYIPVAEAFAANIGPYAKPNYSSSAISLSSHLLLTILCLVTASRRCYV